MALVNMVELVGIFQKGLRNLTAVLDKAATQAQRRGYPAELLLQSRFYPDMYELSRQIQRVADIPLQTIALLYQREAPLNPLPQPTVAGHIQLLQRSNELVGELLSKQGLGLDLPDQSRTEELPHGASDRELVNDGVIYVDGLEFPDAKTWLLDYVLPNFYFHSTTAYNLLRHNGVELGKRDFLGL
jgi:hypothetical protein